MNRKLLSLVGVAAAVFSFAVSSTEAEARCRSHHRNRCCHHGNHGYQHAGCCGWRQNRNWDSGCGQATYFGCQDTMNAGCQPMYNGCQTVNNASYQRSGCATAAAPCSTQQSRAYQDGGNNGHSVHGAPTRTDAPAPPITPVVAPAPRSAR